jgi:hypothetical protein
VPENILAILTNREVIAIDQDKMGRQARRAWKNGDLELWTRPLERGGYAVGLFNRGGATAKMTLHASDRTLRRCRRFGTFGRMRMVPRARSLQLMCRRMEWRCCGWKGSSVPRRTWILQA